jgi:hypothetical protein
MAAVVMVRTVTAAAASLAAMREFRRLGMAIAAMIRMMATTTNNSIRENPRWAEELSFLVGFVFSVNMIATIVLWKRAIRLKELDRATVLPD